MDSNIILNRVEAINNMLRNNILWLAISAIIVVAYAFQLFFNIANDLQGKLIPFEMLFVFIAAECCVVIKYMKFSTAIRGFKRGMGNIYEEYNSYNNVQMVILLCLMTRENDNWEKECINIRYSDIFASYCSKLQTKEFKLLSFGEDSNHDAFLFQNFVFFVDRYYLNKLYIVMINDIAKYNYDGKKIELFISKNKTRKLRKTIKTNEAEKWINILERGTKENI